MSNELNEILIGNVEHFVRKIIPGIKRVGNELECGDIHGNKGSSFKVNIKTGRWGDFATDHRGNQIVGLFIAYYQEHNSSASTSEAMRWIETEIVGRMNVVGRDAQGGKKELGSHLICDTSSERPVDFLYHNPDVAVKPNLNHYQWGEPQQVWEYKNKSGVTVSYVARYLDEKGKKQVIPWSYGQKLKDDGTYTKIFWRMKQQQVPRMAYNINNLDKSKNNFIICEGEKTADFLANHFPNTLTWTGGGKAIQKTDWSWLKNKKVVLCPDNDKAGFKAMYHIASMLSAQGCAIKFCVPPEAAPDGWDYADYDSEMPVMQHIKQNMSDSLPNRFPENEEPAPTPAPIPDHMDIDPEAQAILMKNGESQQPNQNEESAYSPPTKPFEVLGSDNDKIYLLNHKSKRIFPMSCAEMTDKSLYRLAPKFWWDANYAHKPGARPDMLQAADDIIQEAYNKPFFDADKIRGRGVWIDKGDIIMNTGDSVYANGVKDFNHSYKTSHHYIASKPFDMEADTECSDQQAKDITDCFKFISTKEGKMSQDLLLGWCVSSQLGGALKWRPHIWLTGKAGAGKSWVMEEIIQNIVASRAIYPEAGTGEAGIRQELSSDALAVVYEEAESNQQNQAAKIQTVLELARTSSSSSRRGAIYKGSSGGGVAQSFKVRSSFCFLGIQPAIQQRADASRISMIEIHNDNDQDRYFKLQQAVQKLTPEACDGFFLSLAKNAKIIMANIDKFSLTIAKEMGSSRSGDQIGTLLACAWSAYNMGKEATEDDIVSYIHNMNWSSYDNKEDDLDDSEILMNCIMQQNIKFEQAGGGVKTRTIQSTISAALGIQDDDGFVSEPDARIALANIGIYVKKDYDGGMAYGIEKHVQISKMLKDSAWSQGYIQTLARHPNVRNQGNLTQIRAGSKRPRCIMVEFKQS